MRGHVRQRPNGSWAVVIDAGTRPVQRCINPECHKQYATKTGRPKLEVCPACGSALKEGQDRRRRWSTYKTKREAEKARTKLLAAIDEGTFVQPSKVSLADYLRTIWLPATEGTIKPTTSRSYALHIDQHVVPHIGGKPLQKVSGADLAALYQTLRKEGRADRKGGLSPSTIRRVHAMLHKALEDAVGWDYLQRNPAKKAKPPSRKADVVREMGYWDEEEQARFLAHVAGDPLFPLWRLLLATGMRRGEALGLRWADVDLKAGQILIQRSLVAVGYEVRESRPKSGKVRSIDISRDPTTISLLTSHKAHQLAMISNPRDRLVFDRGDGRYLHPDRVSKLFNALVKGSGLRRIPLHGLRHSHAALLASKGAPVKMIQERLGHHSAAFTLDTYGHLFPNTQQQAGAAVAAALG